MLGIRLVGLHALVLAAGGTSGPCTPVPGGGDPDPPPSCEVPRIIRDNCLACHGAQPVAGAPMSLVTWADLHAPARSDSSRPVYDSIRERVRAEPGRLMPPTGSLNDADLAAVDAWVDAGAPNCGFPLSGGTPPTDPPPPPRPIDGCFELRAHGAQTPDDDTPFTVRQDEFYRVFYLRAPNDVPIWGLTFEPIIENPQLIHHWLVYQSSTGVDGTHRDVTGTHPNDPLVLNWEPGGNPPPMPEGVGLELAPAGGMYQLEIHYFNTAGPPVLDRSGVRVCYTKTQQPSTAGQTWLGTEWISIAPNATGSASGRCTPRNPRREDIHIIAATPHMHRLGTRMRTVIHRAGGGTDVVVDSPFSFTDQRTYQMDTVVRPGDTLTTTCSYANPAPRFVGYGGSTTDEMCYNHVIAYPVGALNNPGFSLNGSSNTCLW